MSCYSYLMLASLLSTGVYFFTSKKFAEIVLGFVLLSNGINLLLMESGQKDLEADPLPQALILTAVVIGFALTTFLCSFFVQRIGVNKSDEAPECDEEAVS